MKKLLATAYGVAIAAVCLIGLLFVVTLMPIPGNVKVKVVKSGSMEPAIHTGSIVAIKPEASYKVGDVVTFGKDTKTQIPTTHRIVSIQGEGDSRTYTTRGDANDTADQVTTHFKDIEGRMIFTIPYAGYALAFARTKLGFFLLVGVPALLVFLEEGRSIYMEIRRGRARRRRASRVEEEYEELEPVQPLVRRAEPHHNSDIRSKKVMGAFAILAGASIAGVAGLYGSTGAYFANSATSQGNVLQAGIFEVAPPAPLAAAFSAQVSEVVISDTDAPQDTPAGQTSDATSTPDASPDFATEVSVDQPAQ